MTQATLPILPRLVIKKDSWHYRYFLFIRKFWGMDGAPDRTSICPYCNTIFWFSLFAIVCAPLFVIGWILLKVFRMLYKGLTRFNFTKAVDFLDKSGIGKWMDQASNDGMKDSPAWATGLTAFGAILALAFICGALFILGVVLVTIVCSIPQWPHALVVAFKYAGYGLFHVYAGIGAIFWVIGQALYWAGWGLCWFFTNATIWLVVLKTIFWIVAIGLPSFAIGYLVFRICQTSIGKKILDFLIFKMNGYGEAKKKAAERRSKEVPEPKKQEVYSEDFFDCKPGIISRFFTSGWNKFKSLFKTEVPVGQVVTTVLSPLGIAWVYLKGLKNGVCPLIEFFDDESLAKVAEISKECEGINILNNSDYYSLDSLLDIMSEPQEPTKQYLYDKLTSNPKMCIRSKVYIGNYILGQSTRSMIVDAIKQDLKDIKAKEEAEALLKKMAEKDAADKAQKEAEEQAANAKMAQETAPEPTMSQGDTPEVGLQKIDEQSSTPSTGSEENNPSTP